MKNTVWVGALCVVGTALGYAMGVKRTGSKLMARIRWEQSQVYKYKQYGHVYDAWMIAKKYGVPMDEYLLNMGVHRVAIYGVDTIGIRLYHELKDSKVEVAYALDSDPKWKVPDLRVYALGDEENAPDDEEKNSVDAVIVSELLTYDEEERRLKNDGYTNVFSLDELLYTLI